MELAYKEQLLNKYEAFADEQEPKRKKALQLEVWEVLSQIEVPDAEDLYIWGLTYYMSDDEQEIRLSWATNTRAGNTLKKCWIGIANCQWTKGPFRWRCYNA